MKNINLSLVFFVFLLQSSLCFSQNSYNLIALPDPEFSTHHIGIETAISKQSRLGVMAAYKRASNRPAYGQSNKNVSNDFSRVLVPWTLTKNNAWEDSFFVTALIGIEDNNFETTTGSRAEVTFINLGILVGYQWFWDNGFNISTSFGHALLIANNSNKEFVENESNAVVAYLDKNSKTNNHSAFGLILGWAF